MIYQTLLFGLLVMTVDLAWWGMCYWFGWWQNQKFMCKSVTFLLQMLIVFTPVFPWDFALALRGAAGGILGYITMDTFEVLVEHLYPNLPKR